MILNEHLKLLMKREGKVVLGRYCINLWLLSLVLVATFISIAFSNGSLDYLRDKMEDPFTNWVNIERKDGARIEDFREALADNGIKKQYGFYDVQADSEFGIRMPCIKNNNTHYMEIRYFERMQSDLVAEILKEDNVIGNAVHPNDLTDNSLGFVITQRAFEELGYDLDSIPAYIDYYSYSPRADTLIDEVIYEDGSYGKETYVRAPIPLLAVVKRLPMNMDIIAGKFFLTQWYFAEPSRLNMNNPVYFQNLLFFVSPKAEGRFKDIVKEILPDSIVKDRNADDMVLERTDDLILEHLRTWKRGHIFQLSLGNVQPSVKECQQITKKILSQFPTIDVQRVYDYQTVDKPDEMYQGFSNLSLSFSRLDSISSFDYYAKSKFNVRVEMSQIESKKNFYAVSVMANILSWAMIVFAIVCILIFIVNMLQSYFQKVKRNLGTFKAFGISSSELTRVYVLIMLGITLAAIVIALLVEQLLQWMLPMLGMLKDGEFNLLSLWQGNTWLAIGIIIVATVITVTLVMRNLLKQTPGDLIYDRN